MSSDLAIAAPVDLAVCDVLHALPRGDDSPIARLPPTHFARFTVAELDGVPNLLFLARHDGARAPYLLALAEQTAAVWAHCSGAPRATALPAWLGSQAVKPAYVVYAWPKRSVAEVYEALELHERLARFVVDAPADPVGLAHAFRSAFAR